MNDFADFVRAAGLLPGAIVADGRWRRCPTEDHPRKKNGAYKLATDGLIGWVQNHAVHPEPLTWRPEKEGAAPQMDYQAIRRRNEREQARRTRAIQAAREFYAQCSPLIGGHTYLTRKGLDMAGCRGLKVDREGWLVVPMAHGREIQSVQRIAGDGSKRFWSGAPTTGASYAVDRRGATLTVLCEGLATGLAIYAAVPMARVVVAFTASNLPKVAAQLPRQGMACVAADNDHGTEARIGSNPGILSAREAASILGCAVAIPEGIEGTDWCDLRQERLGARLGREVYGKRKESEGAVRRAVDAEIARAVMRSARFLPATG